jgi:predicted flavoprotein YhiN
VTLSIDLRPDLALPDLVSRLSRPRGKQSAPVAIGLLREATGRTLPDDPRMLGSLIKAVPLPVAGIGSMARAISTAGGVALDEIDTDMMIKTRPGIFVAGEMLDWEAPTGGYLLQACFATGHAAGRGVLRYLGRDLPIPASPGSPENRT